jgi:hypothetical protein
MDACVQVQSPKTTSTQDTKSGRYPIVRTYKIVFWEETATTTATLPQIKILELDVIYEGSLFK